MLRIKFWLIIFCVCALVIGCETNRYSKYLNKSIGDWQSYISSISSKKVAPLNNTIFLILKSNECAPAVSELKWWDKFQADTTKNIEVKLIIIEKYKTTSRVFLEHERISLPFYVDSEGLVFENELIPDTPIKLFINKKGRVQKMSIIGTPENIENFIPG